MGRGNGRGNERIVSVYLENEKYLSDYVSSLVGYSDVDDLLQNTFLKAWRSGGGERNARGFLFRAAQSAAVEHFRKMGRRPDRTSYFTREGKIGEAGGVSEPADRQYDPVAALIRREREEVLRETAAALPKKLREVFILWYESGLSNREKASFLGMSQRNLEHRQRKARKLVRRGLRRKGIVV